jgi:hypothetical protein
MRTCPKCSTQNPSGAWLCACGYEFTGGESEAPLPLLPTPPPTVRLDRFPLFTSAAILTLLFALVAGLSVGDQISRPDFGVVVLALALAYLGFASLLFCLRIILSPHLALPIKLLSILFIVLGVALLGTSLVAGGCSTGVFRFRMNN